MRLPHTIPPHAFEAFRCSEETILLLGEQNRTLRPEDDTWDDESRLPAELRVLSLREIARNWKDCPVDLDSLPSLEDRDHLLELLPLDLPFELAIEKIPYEHYWQRAAEARWRFNDPAAHGDSWLRLYCERHLSEHLERLSPAYFEAEAEECRKLLGLVRPHARVLELRQLTPLRTEIVPPVPPADADGDSSILSPCIPAEPETHHIPMDVVLGDLPYLEEIHVNIGMIFADDDIEWRDFEFSVDDSQRIGRGARGLARLRKFSLTRSSLDQARAAAILQGLAVNLTLEELDFSHCKLGDTGAHAVAAFLAERRRLPRDGLRTVRLTNNGIGAVGLAGIVHGMLKEEEKEEQDKDKDRMRASAVRCLDLRLNPFGDDGAVHLAAFLLRYASLEQLNVSGCDMGADGGMALAEVLASGDTKFRALSIDCSNNHFGPIAGEAFEIVAKSCAAITELDARMCGFRKESEYSISESVNRNKAQIQKAERRRSSGVRTSMKARIKSLAPPPGFEVYQRPHGDEVERQPVKQQSRIQRDSAEQDEEEEEEVEEEHEELFEL